MSAEIFPTDNATDEYRRAIEAIVLVAHDPVPPELLAQLLEQPTNAIEGWCSELQAEYATENRGFELVRVAGGYRYQTVADLTPYVERFVLHDQKARLSGAALETLAIIAYKQPISRAQVASIRGVDPDGVIRTLAARGYIDEVGRDDGPGQAVLFGTTGLFLEKLGLDSIDDLPPIAEFIPGADVVESLEHGLRVGPDVEADPDPAPASGDGAGNDGAIDPGSVQTGTNESGTNDTGTGDTGTHDAGTSHNGTNNTGTSVTGTGDTGTGDTGGAEGGGESRDQFDTGVDAGLDGPPESSEPHGNGDAG